MKRHHHYRSPWRRAAYSFVLLTLVMGAGTIGMHLIERMSYLDAFYFMSMIATAQGSAVTPASAAGKLFASLMAFISVGSTVTALGFLFGPFFGRLWKIGAERFEEEVRWLEQHKSRRPDQR